MFPSVPHLLFSTISKYPDNIALSWHHEGELKNLSYHEFGERIIDLTNGLASLGLQANDKIAILSNNRVEWTISDFAALSLGCVVVPIYQTLPPNQIAYLLHDSESRAIFVEDNEQFKKLSEIRNQLPHLEFIFSYDTIQAADSKVRPYSEIMRSGRQHRKAQPNFYQQAIENIKEENICSIVYTSGTTGEPKGVMLHHKGFVWDIINSEATLNLAPEDVFLSFLPLSHLYERLAGHWCPMYRGSHIHYARSINTVIEDIQIAKPTVVTSVPRVFEKIAARVLEKVEHGSFIKQKLFFWALKTGRKYFNQSIEGTVTRQLQSKYNLAEKLVFQKIREILGGRLRYPIAGGAPLSIETLKFFEALGARIIEGYGMTECHLIITLTPYGKTRYGSCGTAIGGVELRISPSGEILVKGPTVMAGYYNNPEKTREIIDEEGWLHTGDIGHLDQDGYLFITDRIKNIIVTSGGKNISSAPIENRLKSSRYVDEICLVGNQRKFVSALIVPNFEALQSWSKQHNLGTQDNMELVRHPKVLEFLNNEMEILQMDLARYEKVKKFILLPEPFSIEKDELTPSLKVKRRVVENRYKEQIDALYQD